VFTGAYAINPVNGQKIPIWIADYVLASYGTGAIMAVPAHDTRDFEFATKFNLPIIQVVQPPDPKTDWHGFVDDGTSVNSTGPEISITGLPTPEAKKKITAWLEAKGLGKKTVNFKLRDWLFSRQRYWGEPFPIVWKKDAAGNLYHEALPESALPVLPPSLEDYKPTADRPAAARPRQGLGESARRLRARNQHHAAMGRQLLVLSPLSRCEKSECVRRQGSGTILDGRGGSRVESRESRARLKACPRPSTLDARLRELICTSAARSTPCCICFTPGSGTRFCFDLGHVSTPEPFFKLVNQGLILGEDGQKMSKSRGNVVNPDDMCSRNSARTRSAFTKCSWVRSKW
jgi:leucyl-tRNA synthetase